MDKKALLVATAVLLSLAWSACTSGNIKRAAYEAAYQKGCIDRVGTPNCDPEHPTYVEYSSDRERLTRPDAR
ncbi:MAG TPA: hypothetical protein VMV87_10385 [Burkholderiales bacterium]|nr:hypothetical protein [Burkholderiales bacterium]